MKRKQLLEALNSLDAKGNSDLAFEEAAYWILHEFIMQNTKDEEKIPSLLKGVENDT